MALVALGFYHRSWVPACTAGGWSTALGCRRAQLGGGKPFPATGLGPGVGSWAVVTPSLGLDVAAGRSVLSLIKPYKPMVATSWTSTTTLMGIAAQGCRV